MIEFKDFSFKYADEEKYAIKNINLNIKEGESVLITGLSGCGKTTLLRIINGLCPSVFPGEAKGQFRIKDYDFSQSSASKNSVFVGSVLQDSKSGFLFREPEYESKFSAQCILKKRDEIEREYQKIFSDYKNLFSNEDVLNLSTGESQILNILSIKLKKPEIILMDEPSANLDLNEIEELKKNIQSFKDENKTIIIAEHRLMYFEDIVDRIIYMEQGEIVDKIEYKLRDTPLEYIDFKFRENVNDKSHMDILNLSYKIKKKNIIENSNCSIKNNGINAVIGANGCGKSTFGKLITGILKSKDGIIAIDNEIMSHAEIIKNSYFCMQEAYKQMISSSVREEILLQRKEFSEDEILELLSEFDLKECIDRHPSRLSGGQVQRLGVLLAYISNCKIVVLDEPTSGLDYIHMIQIEKIIRRMADEGRFVFLISHDVELLANLADSYLWIEGGKIHDCVKINEQRDFLEMLSKMRGDKEERLVEKSDEVKSGFVNPIVNIIVFLAMANAIFLYPANQSSIYLLAIILIVFLLNKNFAMSIKLSIIYLVLSYIKSLAPIYFKVAIEVFLIRGIMTGFCMKNIIAKRKTIEIIEALYRAKISDYIMIPLISILRLFPTFYRDMSICYSSLKTRKLVDYRNPVLIWNRLIVPLVFSLIRSAENLASGIETKGMVINGKRTVLTDIRFRIIDFVLIISFLGAYIIILGGKIK
ncbi:MAG: ATP-binding cassette domain-containing protein [Tissierellia bacterium]|nr:ATP-binding cassette domain-containing protein [Tissierellia bacterium]